MYSYGNDFTNSITTTDSTGFFNDLANIGAGLLAVFIIIGLLALAFAIFMIIAEIKVYKKAGEPWWKVFIPVYSTWTNAKIAGLAWWWCPIFVGVTALSTCGNMSYVAGSALLVISFNFNYNLSKKFGKTNGFAVLLTLLPIIGLPILAFGSDKYDANIKTDKNGVFAVENGMIK